MIARIWRGWTTPENADDYEAFLRDEVFPWILAKGIIGFRGIDLLRRDAGHEVEFITNMTFDSLAAIEAFAGPERTASVVLPKARALLARFDAHSQHYEIVERRTPPSN
jgi:antibiotic biosynthesis monooxygenase (ABM) superfamily enzyme